MRRIFHAMYAQAAHLIENQMLIRRSTFVSLTVLSVIYGFLGIWILLNRPEGHLTFDEATLIIAFAGVNGVVFSAYNKSRGGK